MKTQDGSLIDPAEYDQILTVATALEVPRQTLQDAISRGDVRSAVLQSGVRIVHVDSARSWAKTRRRTRGRPPAGE